MIRPSLALAPLALAAAASAQTSLSIASSDARTVRTVVTGTTGPPPNGTSTSTSTLVAGLRSGFESGNGTTYSATYRWQALFPLSSIPTGAAIQSATITTSILTTGVYGRHSVGSYASAVGMLTTDMPTVTNGHALPSDTVGSKIIDVTNATRAYVDAGTPFAGIVVETVRNFGQPTTWSAPTLTVTYAPVPEPSAFAALSLGTLGLLRRRRAA